MGESVPGLNVEPAGELRFHTNDVSLAPVTVTLNCSELPIMTVEFPGVSVRVTADLYCAVTVVLAETVKLQVPPDAEVHPLHPLKTSLPSEAGAVSVNTVPAVYVSVKLLVPLVFASLSAGLAVMATPLVGSVEFTVIVYRAGGGGGVMLAAPPPPHP